jgi:hypothetical protein
MTRTLSFKFCGRPCTRRLRDVLLDNGITTLDQLAAEVRSGRVRKIRDVGPATAREAAVLVGVCEHCGHADGLPRGVIQCSRCGEADDWIPGTKKPAGWGPIEIEGGSWHRGLIVELCPRCHRLAMALVAEALRPQVSAERVMRIVVDLNDAAPRSERREALQPAGTANMNMRVDDLDLSVRAANAMGRADIRFVGELVRMTELKMLSIRNFGRTSLREVREALAERGLSFGMRADGWRAP